MPLGRRVRCGAETDREAGLALRWITRPGRPRPVPRSLGWLRHSASAALGKGSLGELRRSAMSREGVEVWLEAFREKDLWQLSLAEDFMHASPFGETHGRYA